MNQFLKNQKYLSALLFTSFFVIVFIWYFGFHKDLTINYNNLIVSKNNIKSQLTNNKNMAKKINSLTNELNLLNEDFESLIGSMPKKSSYDKITTNLFNLIQKNGLKIKDFSPSNFALETKTIIKPNTGEEIIVEKIPIDIELTGSYIDFGRFLDSMLDNYYRFTASDIDISVEGGGINQRIKFIAYVYIHEVTYSPPIEKIETVLGNPQIQKKNKNSNITKVKKKPKIKEKNTNRPNDAPEDIPDWMFEPITEIDSVKSEMDNNINKDLVSDNSKKIINTEIESKVVESSDMRNVYHKMVVTDTKICKQVKNNSPLYTGTRFSTEIGRIHCYSSINNNSGKSNTIYHVWYMNGDLIAKVRIRVAKGDDVSSFSHRDINSSDKGTWKVEITDSDKKILDTIIFELV